jgi:hypothetical protein
MVDPELLRHCGQALLVARFKVVIRIWGSLEFASSSDPRKCHQGAWRFGGSASCIGSDSK